jgi:hypothetical protein
MVLSSSRWTVPRGGNVGTQPRAHLMIPILHAEAAVVVQLRPSRTTIVAYLRASCVPLVCRLCAGCVSVLCAGAMCRSMCRWLLAAYTQCFVLSGAYVPVLCAGAMCRCYVPVLCAGAMCRCYVLVMFRLCAGVLGWLCASCLVYPGAGIPGVSLLLILLLLLLLVLLFVQSYRVACRDAADGISIRLFLHPRRCSAIGRLRKCKLPHLAAIG